MRAVVKRHVPCVSEFDYQGWLEWGEWRRAEKKDGQRDCWRYCDYPSECRWSSHTGSIPGSVVATASIPEGELQRPQMSLEISPEESQHQASGEQKDKYAMGQQPPTTFDGILESFKLPKDKQDGQTSSSLKEDFWSGLPVSVFKHKSGRGKSPLSTIVEDEERSHAKGLSVQIGEIKISSCSIVTSNDIIRCHGG